MVTLANLLSGFISLVFMSKGMYHNAGIFILIGMMFDAMDGRLARMLNVKSEIGKELDSLADIVTFGIAPAMLMYYFWFESLGIFGMMLAGCFPLFGAYRLARFNVGASKSSLDYFTGVPITAAAGIITVLLLVSKFVPDIIIVITYFVLCFLMVSTVKIPSFKNVPIPKYGFIVTPLFIVILYIGFKKGFKGINTYLVLVAILFYIIYFALIFINKQRKKNGGE